MNKKIKELAIHDKDTGSSEIQIALLTEKIETLENVVRLKGLVSKAIENENYDLACKAQSKIYDLTMKAQIRDMIQVSKDQKEAYCSVQKYSLLNN